MSRVIGRLRYFLSDAWDEWRASPGVNLLATATLAVALFAAGLVLLILFNLAGSIGRLRQEAPVVVFLKDGVTEDARAQIAAEIQAVPGIESVSYVDKEEALRRFRASFGDLAELAADLGENPLPASFEAFAKADAGGNSAPDAVAKALRGREGIEEVRHDRAWLDRVTGMLDAARVGGSAVALLVFAAVAFIIGAVMRLAVYARRDEIQIMQLVGASPAFVRGPFVVAGIGHGLIASGIAILLVEAARRAILRYAAGFPGGLVTALAGKPMGVEVAAILVVVGLGVSVLGALLAVRTFETA